MADTVTRMHGAQVLICAPDGPTFHSDRDVLDLIGEAGWAHQAELVVIPVQRLGNGFFTLSTRIAGEITQKFVNYRLHLVILGDITEYLNESSALRDFVYESNRGRHVWFVADLDELQTRLERRTTNVPPAAGR